MPNQPCPTSESPHYIFSFIFLKIMLLWKIKSKKIVCIIYYDYIFKGKNRIAKHIFYIYKETPGQIRNEQQWLPLREKGICKTEDRNERFFIFKKKIV